MSDMVRKKKEICDTAAEFRTSKKSEIAEYSEKLLPWKKRNCRIQWKTTTMKKTKKKHFKSM